MLASNTDGLKALHRVLIKARFRAYLGDGPEYLVDCMMSEGDRTDDFVVQLRGLGEKFADLAEVVGDLPLWERSDE